MFAKASAQEKREVRVGSGREALPLPMTFAQAKRYGDRNMPADLKQVGFETDIFVSDLEINGGTFFRINYGKTIATSSRTPTCAC